MIVDNPKADEREATIDRLVSIATDNELVLVCADLIRTMKFATFDAWIRSQGDEVYWYVAAQTRKAESEAGVTFGPLPHPRRWVVELSTVQVSEGVTKGVCVARVVDAE